MAAGTPVVASDLEAFRRVLQDGARRGARAGARPGRAGARRSATCCTTSPAAPGSPRRPARPSRRYDWRDRHRARSSRSTRRSRPPSRRRCTSRSTPTSRCSRRCSTTATQEDDAGRLVTTLRRWIAERPRRERVAVIDRGRRSASSLVVLAGALRHLDRRPARPPARPRRRRVGGAGRRSSCAGPPRRGGRRRRCPRAGGDGARARARRRDARRRRRTGREALENDLSRALRAALPLLPPGADLRRARAGVDPRRAGPRLPQRRGPRHPGRAPAADPAGAAPGRPPRAAAVLRDRRHDRPALSDDAVSAGRTADRTGRPAIPAVGGSAVA